MHIENKQATGLKWHFPLTNGKNPITASGIQPSHKVAFDEISML